MHRVDAGKPALPSGPGHMTHPQRVGGVLAVTTSTPQGWSSVFAPEVQSEEVLQNSAGAALHVHGSVGHAGGGVGGGGRRGLGGSLLIGP